MDFAERIKKRPRWSCNPYLNLLRFHSKTVSLPIKTSFTEVRHTLFINQQRKIIYGKEKDTGKASTHVT